MLDRRAILKTALALAAGQLAHADSSGAATPAGNQSAAPNQAQPFDFAWLKGQAHWLASNLYQPSKETLPPAMAEGVTVPTAGVPVVPGGTVMVTEESVAVVAVVKP